MSDFATESFYDAYWEHRIARGDVDSPKRVKLRHEQAAAFLRDRLTAGTGARVLDLGCGDGAMGEMLQSDGYEVEGVDVSPRVLAVAERWYEKTRRFDMNRDELPEAWRSAFDAVVCLEVLEHLEHPRRSIEHALAVLKPGGVAAFSFPNLFSWKNRLAFVRGRWPKSYTTYDPREHLQVFELEAFESWLREAGFVVESRAITPDLPRPQPFRNWMFKARGALGRWSPTLWAMQINVFTHRPAEAAVGDREPHGLKSAA